MNGRLFLHEISFGNVKIVKKSTREKIDNNWSRGTGKKKWNQPGSGWSKIEKNQKHCFEEFLISYKTVFLDIWNYVYNYFYE